MVSTGMDALQLKVPSLEGATCVQAVPFRWRSSVHCDGRFDAGFAAPWRPPPVHALAPEKFDTLPREFTDRRAKDLEHSPVNATCPDDRSPGQVGGMQRSKRSA